MKKFETEKWIRKDQYDFFNNYEDPFFGIGANVDVSKLKVVCKEKGLSFFLASLYCSTRAANTIENFRLRIKDDQLYLVDQLQVGSTILKEDKTFTFCYMKMEDSLESFCIENKKRVEVQLSSGHFDPHVEKLELLYYSVIPWISFTYTKHPRNKEKDFSIPRIVFGKYFEENERTLMPVSVEAHHSLMDGYHVGQYFERFQNEINGV